LRLDSNTISSTNTNGNIIISPTGTGRVGIKQNNPNYTLDVNGSGNFSSGLYVNNIAVSISGHTHTSSDITDFNSAVSGLLPVKNISAGNYISVSDSSGNFTINATGLQPSGNYSVVGHTHLYTDITNFASGVEQEVSTLLVAGNYINLNYNNIADTLTISATGLQPSGVYASGIHTHTASQITDFNEAVDDRIGSGLFVAGTGINLTYNDIGNSFTVSVSGLINNPTNNRILTSRDNTTTGIDAESNLTFDGNLLSISGNLVANTGTINSLNFNNIGDPDLSIRQLAWNNSEGSLAVGLSDTYEMFLGGELHYRVRNNTGSSILAGTAVYATGLTPGGNNRIEIAPKAADGSIREVRFMGLVTENIDNGVNGFTTHFGYIRNIDTRGDYAANGATNKVWASGEPVWAEGDLLYVHPTVAGKLTKIEPKHSISVAIILNRHQNQGKLFVRPTSYGHLNDNHDVAISGATNGQFLQYNSETDYWVPSSSGNFTTLLVNGIAASVSGHTHTSSDITDFNSSVSGLLPTINNSGNNRILTSTGSSTGINAESSVLITEDGTLNPTNGAVINDNAKSIVFSGNRSTALQIFNIASLDQNEASEASLSWSLGVVSSGSSLNYINGSSSSVFSSIPSGISNSGVMTGSAVTSYRNAVSSYDDNGSLFFLIGQGISYGHAWAESTSTNTTIARGLSISPAAGAGTIENVYDIFLTNTVYDTVIDSSGTIQQGTGVISNRYGIYQESADPNYFAGSLTVGSGLSSPTPIFSLGTVSGNVSINYGIDKQIQTLTLNGTATNFIEGSGWDIASKSVDVFLEITVTNTTTVTWTLIDDQYNAFPTFVAGKYLVLLRSMGTTIQGHYIGDKTN
jgi:hypothetical protein